MWIQKEHLFLLLNKIQARRWTQVVKGKLITQIIQLTDGNKTSFVLRQSIFQTLGPYSSAASSPLNSPKPSAPNHLPYFDNLPMSFYSNPSRSSSIEILLILSPPFISRILPSLRTQISGMLLISPLRLSL